MISTGKMKTLDTKTLKRLADHAIALKFSHGPNAEFWQDVDPDGTHLVTESYFHAPSLLFWHGRKHGFDFSHNGGVNVRALVLCKMKGSDEPLRLLCDFDEQDFLALPDLEKDTPKGKAARRKKNAAR